MHPQRLMLLPLLLPIAFAAHGQSKAQPTTASKRDEAVRSAVGVGATTTTAAAVGAGTARVLTDAQRQLESAAASKVPYPYRSVEVEEASLYRDERLDKRSSGLKTAGKVVDAAGHVLSVGSITYDSVRCYQGADCTPAFAGAAQYGFELMASATPGGIIASRAINIVDGGWRLVDPKGRGGVEAVMDEAIWPAVAPRFMGLEYVDEWDSYATHAQASQFRHSEQVANIAEQKIRAREFAESFNPVYTPRDGGGAYDPLAEILRATQAGMAPNCSGEECAGAAVEPQENECDHVGHDPSHICDATGRTISRGGGS